MAFYLEKAIFVNRAPFEHLELDFIKNGINVLSAINGRGKTTILSHIVDAFYELARLYYSNEFEDKINKYYRISSSLYNLDMNKSSYVYLRFINNGKNIDYIDVRKECSQVEYDSALNIDNKIPIKAFAKRLKKHDYIKYWHIDSGREKIIPSLFENYILTYFPSYRHETPSYLNDPYLFKYDFKIDGDYSGYLDNPIEVITGMRQLANWIMDVVLDWDNYKKTQQLELPDGTKRLIDNTPELIIWHNLNDVIKETLSSKRIDGTIRLGIGKRNNAGNRISVVSEKNGIISTISPNLFCLSAGESSLLCCFGEILRQADKIHTNTLLKDIQGIVLIDEVDKHLHIKLQKEVLPKLFKLFPNVQFIVSSHSPFLNMGLADEAMERTQIMDLENNGIVCEPTNNDLFKEVYDTMISENQRFADKYKELETKVHAINKPIIITEGKTDWKHLKAALHFFIENHEYNDLDVEILEYDFDFGDSKLHNLLNQYKTFPHRYTIIGIFDCDEANGKGIRNEGGIKQYGNNIWGMSIDIPEFRDYITSGISIEFLYKDADLKLKDGKGRRLYVTSEFDENGRLKSNHTIGVKNYHDVKNYVLPEKEKIQADEVIDTDGNSLALSKEQFAINILEKIGDFANVDFGAFRPIFDRIKSIVQQAKLFKSNVNYL